MFNRKHDDNSDIQDAIDNVLNQMHSANADSNEFSDLLDKLERLYKIKNHQDSKLHVSPDVLVPVVGNLVGIFAVLNYERVHVVASKAFGMIIKPKI